MTETPLRVVYVITSTGVGGAERQVYDLAATFRSRGWGVGVVSMLPMHEQFLPLLDSGVRLASLGMTQGVPDPRALVRLARLLRAWRPDVVHGHMIHANLLTRLARLLVPGPRLISTIHNQYEGHQWHYYAYRLTRPLADVTTTVSQVALDEAVRRHAAPATGIRVVHNGIESQKFDPGGALRAKTRNSLGIADEFTWLSVGRLTEAKRHTDLLAAMRIVSGAMASMRLLIAGVGPLHSMLEAEIEQTGLSRTVSLLGLRGDVPSLMQAADGFVLSSAWEGLPMVLLEAGASALPIVATDVGGSAETVLPGTTGWLVPPRRPETLAEAMISLMTMSPNERRAMGRRARDHIARSFDMATIADQWEAIYRG